jgi:hypothetical protein
VKLRRTNAIAPLPQPINARAAAVATHVPTPPLSGSSSIGALEVALAEGLAIELTDALALAVALAEALVPALSCTNKTFRLSAKTVPTANAL